MSSHEQVLEIRSIHPIRLWRGMFLMFLFVVIFFSGGFWLLVAFVFFCFCFFVGSWWLLCWLLVASVGFWLLWLLTSLASTAVVLELTKLCCSQWPGLRMPCAAVSGQPTELCSSQVARVAHALALCWGVASLQSCAVQGKGNKQQKNKGKQPKHNKHQKTQRTNNKKQEKNIRSPSKLSKTCRTSTFAISHWFWGHGLHRLGSRLGAARFGAMDRSRGK